MFPRLNAISQILSLLGIRGKDSSWSLTPNDESNGFQWTQQVEPTAPGITLITTINPTASANVDLLDAFSSTYDNYLIIGQGVAPATTDGLAVRVAVAGVADTGSNYYRLSGVLNTTTAAVARVDLSGNVLAAGTGLDFSIQVKNVNSTTKLKSLVYEGVGHQDATPTYGQTYVSGAYPAASAVTGLRLFWQAGNNFAAVGTIYVYGYRKT